MTNVNEFVSRFPFRVSSFGAEAIRLYRLARRRMRRDSSSATWPFVKTREIVNATGSCESATLIAIAGLV